MSLEACSGIFFLFIEPHVLMPEPSIDLPPVFAQPEGFPSRV